MTACNGLCLMTAAVGGKPVGFLLCSGWHWAAAFCVLDSLLAACILMSSDKFDCETSCEKLQKDWLS